MEITLINLLCKCENKPEYSECHADDTDGNQHGNEHLTAGV